MSFRRATLLAVLALPSVAWAIQSVDAGLQPLYARVAEIQSEQLALIRKLETRSASSASKSDAYRHYLMLGEERSRIDTEITQAKWMENSGLVKYGTQ
jgi:hypothetical protein